MKQKIIKKSAVSIIATAAIMVCLAACKKDFVPPTYNTPPDDIPEYTAEARAVVGRIKKFEAKIADKENLMRSSEGMPLDSVIWNIESLFNVSYTFPDRKYLETVKQELSFTVSLNADNEVLLRDVAVLYEEVIGAVRQAYANDGISANKSLMAVVVEKGEIYGSSAEIIIYVISGRVMVEVTSANLTHGPFGPGDEWYYGEYGGTCDDPSVWGDAAEIIEDTINYYWGGSPVPQTGFRSMNVNMTRVILDGNEFLDDEGIPYIYFYALNDNPPLCLNDSLLNYYYYRELEVILHLIPTTSPYMERMPPQPAFLEVDIIGMMNHVWNITCLQHKNYIIYCSKWAVPVHILGPARDLLG